MRFDREMPCSGVEVYTEIKNGKAYLEWKFYVSEAEAELESESESDTCLVCLRIFRQEGDLAAECFHDIREEENAKTMILHPHLWGIADPYLYHWCAYLIADSQRIVDKAEGWLPLRTFCERIGKGWFLNGELLQIKGVKYRIGQCDAEEDDAANTERLRLDLECLKKMGANAICPDRITGRIAALCDEIGFVIGCFGEGNSLLFEEIFCRGIPTELFFLYKAKWSKEPFVHISREGLCRQPNGLYRILIYSNQKKVALYIDGILFGFLSGEAEFLFEELPVNARAAVLTAEAGECSESVTFPSSQFFHNYITFP